MRAQQTLLQQQKAQQRQHIAEQLVAVYKTGQQSQLQLMLNQSDPQLLSRMLRYNELLLSARQEKVDEFSSTLAQLDQIAPQIEAHTAVLNNSQSSLVQQREKLQSAQRQRKQTLAKLNTSIDNKDRQLQKSAGDRAHLERIMAEVVRQLSDVALALPGQAFTSRKGRMGWPAKGRLASQFGSVRAGNNLRWQGVLIDAPEGREVKAIHQGRVIFSDYMRGQGMLLIIDHGDNYLSLYAHNQVLYKETGDWVSAGDLVGRVGNSGGQANASLYFEIRHQGKPVNPAQWCQT